MEILNERHSEFCRQHFRHRLAVSRNGNPSRSRSRSAASSRRKDSFERYVTKFARSKVPEFSEIPIGLPGLPQRNVASNGSRISTRTEVLLPSNEYDNLAQSVNREREDLRWRVDRFQQRTGVNHADSLLTNENEIDKFREIRLNLNPKHLFDVTKEKFEFDSTTYKYFKSKDGSYRINCGRVNLNVSDFLTKKMNLSFDEAKPLLVEAYAQQRQYFDDRAENHEKNQIIFESNIYERLFNSNINEDEFFYRLGLMAAAKITRGSDMSRLDDISKRFKGRAEELTNAITGADEDTLSIKSAMSRAKSQREFDKSIDFKGLIKTPDANKKSVTYSDQNGTTAFVDAGSKIKFSRNPDPKQVELGLQLATEKFGTVKLTGSKEFKEQVLQVAAERGMNLIFKDENLQERFLQLKDLHQNGNQISDIDVQKQERNAETDSAQSISVNAVVDAKQHKQTEQQDVGFDFNDAIDRVRDELASDHDSRQNNNEKNLNIKFSFDETTDAYVMKINGVEPARAISEKVMERLRSADKYLQNFNVEQIKSGVLPLADSKGQHPLKELDVTLSQLKNPNFTTDKIERAVSMQNKTGHVM